MRSRPSPVRVVVFSCLLFARRSAQQGEPSSTWIATADARRTANGSHTRVGRDVWQLSLPQPSRGRGDFECSVRLFSFFVVGRPPFVALRAVKSKPVPRPMRRARETRHACVPTDPELKGRWTEPPAAIRQAFSACWNERAVAIGGVCRWLLAMFGSTRPNIYIYYFFL